MANATAASAIPTESDDNMVPSTMPFLPPANNNNNQSDPPLKLMDEASVSSHRTTDTAASSKTSGNADKLQSSPLSSPLLLYDHRQCLSYGLFIFITMSTYCST